MIAILTAMEKEYDLVKSALSSPKYEGNYSDDVCFGWIGHEYVILVKTGIGKVNAAYALSSLLERQHGIERVISLGCAGAAVPTLKVGDIVIGNAFCYHDVWCGAPFTEGQVQGLPSVFHSSFSEIKDNVYIHGTIASGDWFVQDKGKIQAIIDYLPKCYNIVAVDMESAALAHVCYIKGLPFVSIRVISDNPLNTNQNEQYSKFWDYMAQKCFQSLIDII